MKKAGEVERSAVIRSAVYGTIFSLVAMLGMISILSAAVVRELVRPETAEHLVIVIQGISLLVGCLITNVKGKTGSLVSLLLVFICVLTVLLLLHVTLVGTAYNAFWIKAVSMLLGTMSAYVVCMLHKDRVGKGYRRYMR